MVAVSQRSDVLDEEPTRVSAVSPACPNAARDVVDYVGPYRILGELGRGGMADVFLAEREGLEGFRKWFALKRPHRSLGPELHDLFHREARLAALVSHVNVVSVLELRWVGGEPWMVMEYVRGPTLRRVLGCADARGEALPVLVALVIAADAARGVRAVHEARTPEGAPCAIVHRDISPSNFIVDPHGVTRLLDFGIACPATEFEGTTGKTAYMAPELARDECDARSDVFSLGAVVWELIVGRRAFERGRVGQRQRPPRIRSIRSSCPIEVDELVDRMLDDDPSRRPAMHDVVRVLARAARDATHEDVASALLESGAAFDERSLWATMADAPPNSAPTHVWDRAPPEVSGLRTIVSPLELDPLHAEE